MRHRDANPAGLAWGCPREPVPTAAACGVRAHFSLWLCCRKVPRPLALPPRSDLVKAPEMLLAVEPQGWFLGQVSWQDGRAPSWSPEDGSLLAHAPIPGIACPGRMAPAPQGWGGWAVDAGKRCPTANSLHEPGEPGPSSGRGVSPAPQIQVGEKKNPNQTPDSGYFSPFAPAQREDSPPWGHPVAPPSLSRCRWLRSRLPHGSSAAVPPRL